MSLTRKKDDEGRRWYSDGDTSFMSVTTVLGFLEQDETGLDIWKDRNDGSGDAPYHEHLFWYSGPRGTLCHYQALVKFEDCHDGDDMWGKEETKAMKKVMEGPEEDDFEDAPEDNSEVVYSLLKNQEIVNTRDEYEALFKDNTRIIDVLHENVEYFVEGFSEICDLLGVDDGSVIRVEKFMLNEEDQYGGQCDLVYEDPEGNVVLADLKTSGSLREKHRLQAVAYMKAVEKSDWGPDEVDRIEVWRIHPDTETWTIHADHVPPHAEDIDGYTDDFWFEDKWGDFSYDSIEDMWTTFKELAEEAHKEIETC